MPAGSKPSKPKSGDIAKAAIQILFATGRTFSVEQLRSQIRALYPEALGTITTVSLLGALIEAGEKLTAFGLRLDTSGGSVCLRTTQTDFAMGEFLRRETNQTGIPDLSTGAMEVLACVALKQPVSFAEVEKFFGTDKRAFLTRLKEMELISSVTGPDGRIRFVTTAEFLRRFQAQSLADIQAALQKETQ